MKTYFFPLSEFISVADAILWLDLEDQMSLCEFVTSVDDEIYFGIMFENDEEEEESKIQDFLDQLTDNLVPFLTLAQISNHPRFYN
jgi:hypothetical protein